MNWRETIERELRLRKTPEERESERYVRVDIDFSDGEYSACTMKKIGVFGDYLAKAKYTGNVGDATIRLGHRHSPPIHVSEFKKTYAEYDCLYLTTSDTSGHVIVYIGRAFSGEIDPSGGQEVKVLSTAGTEVDVVQDKRFQAHDLKFKEQTEQTAPGTRERLMAVSTPVKWAIIHFETIARIGDVTITVDVGAHPGQHYGADSYLAVEYCDLYDMYIMDAAGTAVKYTVTYVEEG